MIWSPRWHLVLSGDIFACNNWEWGGVSGVCYWHLVDRCQDNLYPPMTKDLPSLKREWMVARLRNPDLNQMIRFDQMWVCARNPTAVLWGVSGIYAVWVAWDRQIGWTFSECGHNICILTARQSACLLFWFSFNCFGQLLSESHNRFLIQISNTKGLLEIYSLALFQAFHIY